MGHVPLQEQTLYSAITFRHLLDSLARPGKINQLEYPHFVGEPPYYHLTSKAIDVPVNRYALGAMLTLLDREVTFVVATDGEWLAYTDSIVQWLALRSGATITNPASAMFALFCQDGSNGLVTQLNRGTLLEPESSTTAFYCVERLAEGADGHKENADWLTLELMGPGIESMRKVSVMGLDRSEIKLMNIARRDYPLGIDVYLIDGLGRCIGLSRTTRIQMIGKEI